MGFIPVGAAARRASLLRLLSCCVHVPRSVSPSIRLLAPLGCCEYHSCERRWTEISLGPCFQYSQVHTKILDYTATHLPPDGFQSRGLPTFPGAQRRKAVLYPAIPELLFRASSYLHPCALLSASAGTSFWSPTVALPLVTRLCEGCYKYSFSQREGNRDRPSQDQPVSTRPLLSLWLAGTHCRPGGAAMTGLSITLQQGSEGRLCSCFCNFPDGSALLYLLHVC